MHRAAILALLAGTTFFANAQTDQDSGVTDAATKTLAHAIFKQLIEINTTDSVGNVSTASIAMQQRLLDAGFAKEDMFLGGPNDRKQNLVLRYKGTGKQQPILLIGHEDVVEARREDWTTDPFQFVEKDGFYYGRGTQDMKESDAILVTTLIRLKKSGFVPDRDLILALTADEEGGRSNGVAWLLANHPDLVKAAYVINPDGGSVDLEHGKAVSVDIDASEKMYADYQVLATNAGGHSSLPVPDNAIYHVADAMQKLAAYSFPFELNAITRGYFAKMSDVEAKAGNTQLAADEKAILATPPDAAAIARLSKDPAHNSTLHTTCVATRLLAGHANNALPQMAKANVNCRILPGHSIDDIREDLVHLFNDPKLTVEYVDDSGDVHHKSPTRKALPPAAINPQVQAAMDRLSAKYWPGAAVVPTMADGASDGVYTSAAGMPTYGISGIELETDDVRAHGKDERLPVTSFEKGTQFYYEFIRALSSE